MFIPQRINWEWIKNNVHLDEDKEKLGKVKRVGNDATMFYLSR